MQEFYVILLIFGAIGILLAGFPVALSLAGSAIFFAFIGYVTGYFDAVFLSAFPSRVYGIMGNQTLLAVPLFIFMGMLLERSRISEELLESAALLFGNIRGGLGVSICLVGALLAASTGIVGATVVTMGLISLPTMLKYRYNPGLACGIVAASGTLGQIIPPSIILIILGDQISSAYQQSLLSRGIYSGDSLSVGDLFAGALLPGFLLVLFYIIYILLQAWIRKDLIPAMPQNKREAISSGLLLKKIFKTILAPIFLIISVLGSILIGLCTPTEAASVGCVGSLILAYLKKTLNKNMMREVIQRSLRINSMVFLIVIGASMFSLVFRGYGGDEIVSDILSQIPGGKWSAFLLVMLLIFFLGFFLDFFEICFVVVPIVGPVLLNMGFEPIWLGVVIALNLQTSFLTPPLGFALFYLRGVAPPSIKTSEMYRGVIPFILIQLLTLLLLFFIPELANFLPKLIYER